MSSDIIYTHTDEAPALATASLFPILKGLFKTCGIGLEKRDISLSGRILAAFRDKLENGGSITDDLAELGELCKTPKVNLIKLPNISASVPQLKGAIAELQKAGYAVPDYPAQANTAEDKDAIARYAKVLGSAVNPVLREGNSDRRVALPVKEYAKKHPHSMGAWQKSSKSHVDHMQSGDFFGSEKSWISSDAGSLSINFHSASGEKTVLKSGVSFDKGDVMDASCMSRAKLESFFEGAIRDAKEKGILFSLHLKATMMKVSDPQIFGYGLRVFFKDVFAKHQATFDELGINPNYGLGEIYSKLEALGGGKAEEIKKDLQAAMEQGPDMAMVDSDKGITNLHVPSDVIIDASMPAAIRTSGQMWNKEGKLQDTKFVIPDRSYAEIYQEVISFCKENGAFDPSTMGTVPNVGLMAKKAEEYGSHDKTFIMPSAGTVKVETASGEEIFSHEVGEGDIWRMCQTKDVAIKDWVKLAVTRARSTGWPAIFWLNENRAHDSRLREKVQMYLKDHDISGLTIEVMNPKDAMAYSLKRIKAGEDTISVTGNVLRDYLTDLFPILELGTSAKMLSIVPLLQGGGLFETGAGGSAPKHVQQFVEQGHLRWDSLGEFLALAVSLEDLAEKTGNKAAKVLSDTLTAATTEILDNQKSPSRKVGELDTRGSHFYLTMYWARQLQKQTTDTTLAEQFKGLSERLQENESKIMEEYRRSEGKPVDIGGYYFADPQKMEDAMHPSPTFRGILKEELGCWS